MMPTIRGRRAPRLLQQSPARGRRTEEGRATSSTHVPAAGSARAAFIARIREIAEEYRRGLGPTASMAEIFAALREYDRRRPQAQSHTKSTNRRPRP